MASDGNGGTPPPNFSWCEPGRLSACAFPELREHLDYLINNNVGCIVSLTAERKIDTQNIPDDVLHIVQLPIKDYTSPTMDQVEEFLRSVFRFNKDGKGVCVHCAHGMGRTGTMLACYYVKARQMSAANAIAHVRKLRPGSIETAEQEALVHTFAEYLQQKLSNGAFDKSDTLFASISHVNKGLGM